MHRDLPELARIEYDVLVVVGGAAGAAAAREAALRGYRTALIEREDFGAGSSAHCFKVVHGGIRYIQHGDVKRLRASCHERSVFLRLAPHLVKPLPFLIPTYGWGRNGKGFLGAGMLLYDALSADRNRHTRDRARRISWTRFFSRAETLRLFPSVPSKGLTGAAAFEDGQMHNAPRLVLAFAAAAHELGASVANYVAAEHLLIRDKRVYGVAARDVLTGDRFDIRAKVVINAAGPWAEGLLRGVSAAAERTPGTYSRDACFVIDRRPTSPYALAVPGASHDADAILARSARHLFMVPWRERTLVGVWHSVVPRDPDATGLTREELRAYIAEINACHPGFNLRESEVERVDFGLVPFGDATEQRPGSLSFGKQSRLIDHRRLDGIAGLVTSISVRYTVARMDAVRAVRCAGRQILKHASRDPRLRHLTSETMPLPGGAIEDIEALAKEVQRTRPAWLSAVSAATLLANFGTHMSRVLALADADASLRACVAGTDVTYAEIAYALREESAQTMSDIVFRRTELGTAGHPGEAALAELAAFLQSRLGWSDSRTAEERRRVDAQFARYLASAERTCDGSVTGTYATLPMDAFAPAPAPLGQTA
ncbi:MAG TPA: FAD-dependent oxidoreductase [Steroidobacteraceae bacterium]|nr:FAD-dependent oxidoreductase [Steroidobacteraceae bacterium]